MLRFVSFLVTLLVYFEFVQLPEIQVNCAINGNSTIDAPIIGKCEKFNVEEKNTTIEEDRNLKGDEHSVAALGHVQGLKPESYNLSFYFMNRTHFEGYVEIRVIVRMSTKKIVLNRHANGPEIDYEKITVRMLCEDSGVNETGCIEKVTVMDDAFILHLTKPMRAGEAYMITIPSFHGTAYDDYSEMGSIGLSGSGGNEQGYWGLTTIFQMRYARSVFPCFDHPSMKAKFHLCLEHPSAWSSASNMPLSHTDPIKKSDQESIRNCFKETPIISTYVFTMALMENYTYTNWSTDDGGPLIELYAPNKKVSQLKWMLKNTSKSIRLMESITNVSYVLPRLAHYVVYPSPFWGIENFGLITTDGAWMEQGEKGDKASMILNHEIVHQWLGNLATISEWREICLQEGMTAFLEWKLSEQLNGVSIQQQANAAAGRKSDYPSFLRRYNLTQHIADNCFGMPPLFFKLISDYYGFEVWQRFWNKLFTNKAYGNANVKYWDKLLLESTGDENLNGYLESWFGQPGFAYIFVSINDRGISITQGRAENYDHVVVTDETIRPFPITVLAFTNQSINITIPKKQTYSIPLENFTDDSWVILDPDGLVMARKIYELKTYKKFVCTDTNSCENEIITNARKQLIWRDFCNALLMNAFPWGQDEKPFKSDAWADFFHQLVKNEKLDRECKCCVSTKEENEKSGYNCAWQWNRECKKLRIVQLLGRNYTMPNENPWGRP